MKKTALLLPLLVIACICKAQIFYYDITPDSTMSTWNATTFQIDSAFTANLTHAQATIVIWEEFGSVIDINAFGNCEVRASGTYPLPFDAGQVIDSTGSWIAPAYSVLYDGSNGYWQGKTDKYLAVRIHEGSKIYYGWIRLDVNGTGSSVTMKDYACNMSSGRSIKAGQKDNTAVQNVEPTKVHAFVSNKTVSLAGLEDGQNYSVSISDMSGNTLKYIPRLQTNNIDLSAYPAGIYIISLQDSYTRQSIKVHIGD